MIRNTILVSTWIEAEIDASMCFRMETVSKKIVNAPF